MAEETSSSLSTLIDQAQNNILGFLDSQASVVGADGSMLNANLFISLLPFGIWLGVIGIKLMLGYLSNGEAIRKELTRVFLLLLILVMGKSVFQGVNMIGQEAQNLIIKQSTTTSIMVQVGMDGHKQKFNVSKFFSEDELADFRRYQYNAQGIDRAGMVTGVWDFVCANITKTFTNTSYSEALNARVKNNPEAMAEMMKIEKSYNIYRDMKGVNEGRGTFPSPSDILNRYNTFVEDKSITDMTFSQIISYLLMCIGKLFRMIMLIFQKLLLTMMQLAFPFAITLSLIPAMEETWKSWLQNYISITLLGVTIAIVGLFQALASYTVIAEPIYSIILMFVTGIMYLLSPALNTIFFGGSGAISGLPGQIVQTGAAQVGIATKLYKHVTKMPGSPLKGKEDSK